MGGRSFISGVLVFSLLAQNLLYAGGPGRERRLEDPLLAADYLVAPHRGPVEEKPDLELATLSSAPSEADLEVESRSESLLAPLSADATTFLDRYGLTADHLRERDISFADFQRLFDMDTSLLWNWARVVAINRVIPHALEAPFRGGRPRWPEGGMAPIHRPSKRTIPAFIDAFTAFTYENLERVFKLTILGFLVVDFQEANSVSSAISLLWGNEEHTVNHLLSFFQTAPGPYILGAGLALPFVWGAIHGALTARQVRHDAASQRTPRLGDEDLLTAKASRFRGFADHLTAHPQTAWSHYGLPFLMWFVPFKEDPIAEHLSEMVATLRWNSTLTAEEGRDIFRAAQTVSTQRGISGLMATDQLLEIMHGVNFKDFRYLLNKPGELSTDEKERLLMYLELKTQALTHLKELADLKAQWAGRRSIPEGLERVLKALYTKSLLWYGGQSGGWDDPAAWLIRGFMLGLKAVKTWLLVNLLTALVNSLVEFAHCPNEFKDIIQGEIGPVSDTLACFNEYVRIFNQIPGQPVETLTDLIPNVAFPGNQYALDLSNKGIGNATTLVRILDAFSQDQIVLRAVDLSGNFLGGGSENDYGAVGEALGRHPEIQKLFFGNNALEGAGIIIGSSNNTKAFIQGWEGKLPLLKVLDLSNNQIGNTDSRGTVAIGEGLHFLLQLTSLNLSNNRIGYTDSEGTAALGDGLHFLPQLTSLDLSGTNCIGCINSNGTVAIGEGLHFLPQLTSLDLSGNNIGTFDSRSAVAIGENLHFLPQLTSLNLNTNGIGLLDSSGTVVIGENLHFLPQLTSLNLINNYIGYTDSNGTAAIGEGLRFLSHLRYLDLNTNSIGSTDSSGTVAIGEGLHFLPQLTSLDLGNNYIDFEDSKGMVAIGEGLHFLPQLMSLDLSYNDIGYTDSKGTAAIGENLHFLPQLTFLDLSANDIGYTDSNGTIALGQGLQNNHALQTLNLASNNLGRHGPEELVILLESVVHQGLNLNLAGAVNVPWTLAANALYTLNEGPIQNACYQQRCFGDTPQNTTTIQSVGARRVLAVEEVSVGEEEMGGAAPQASFLTRWGQNVRGFVTHATTSTKQTVWSYWDSFGDWLTKILTDAAHEVVTKSPSYFPNGNNPNVRDWPVGGLYFNGTNCERPQMALGAIPLPALP